VPLFKVIVPRSMLT